MASLQLALGRQANNLFHLLLAVRKTRAREGKTKDYMPLGRKVAKGEFIVHTFRPRLRALDKERKERKRTSPEAILFVM